MKKQYKKPEVTVVEFNVEVGSVLSVKGQANDFTAAIPMTDGAEQYTSYGVDFSSSSSWEN